MTPIFAIDITLDKKSSKINGEEFITATVDAESAAALDEKQEELQDTVEMAKLPLWLRILSCVAGLYALTVGLSQLRAGLELGFANAFNNAPFLIISAGVCAIAWGVVTYLGRKRKKDIFEATDAEGKVNELKKKADLLYSELGVPETAPEVDVLMFRYKLKEGEIKAKTVGFQTAPYLNLSIRLYSDGEYLHLADVNTRFSLALSELKAIRTVKKRISVSNWNKDDGPTKGEYKQYKMTVNNVGDIFMKPYYVLELIHGGEEYCVYFPCYELSALESATGLKATE